MLVCMQGCVGEEIAACCMVDEHNQKISSWSGKPASRLAQNMYVYIDRELPFLQGPLLLPEDRMFD